jgi:hypothetical protein
MQQCASFAGQENRSAFRRMSIAHPADSDAMIYGSLDRCGATLIDPNHRSGMAYERIA